MHHGVSVKAMFLPSQHIHDGRYYLRSSSWSF